MNSPTLHTSSRLHYFSDNKHHQQFVMNIWIAVVFLHVLAIVSMMWLRVHDFSTLKHVYQTTAYTSTRVRTRTVNTNRYHDEEVEDNDDVDPSRYRILMMHYHKTGFVLSRQLRSLAANHLTRSKDTNETSTIFHIPEKNWGSIQQPRKFNHTTKCPENFRLEGGYINVQESPDLYCNVEALVDVLLNVDDIKATQETRIIHFVRNPYSMALSNYFYHTQDPT
jgi:hypothetical protein